MRRSRMPSAAAITASSALAPSFGPRRAVRPFSRVVLMERSCPASAPLQPPRPRTSPGNPPSRGRLSGRRGPCSRASLRSVVGVHRFAPSWAIDCKVPSRDPGLRYPGAAPDTRIGSIRARSARRKHHACTTRGGQDASPLGLRTVTAGAWQAGQGDGATPRRPPVHEVRLPPREAQSPTRTVVAEPLSPLTAPRRGPARPSYHRYRRPLFSHPAGNARSPSWGTEVPLHPKENA